MVTLPKLLGGEGVVVGPASKTDDEKALFVIESLLKRLRSSLAQLRPTPRKPTGWSRYMETHSYDADGFSAKEAFVRAALSEFKPQKVLDVGANTGHFSELAAGLGAQVVAIDSDAACAGECFARARQDNLDILPLVVDIARPTPSLGWRNGECASFLDRARGHFDAVLMLALVHHLLVTERVPLNEIIDLAAELTKSLLIIEFVPFEDPMFQRLLRGRDALFGNYNREFFERSCECRFEIVRSADIPGTARRLYLLRKR
jgi:SAM-dependent methyltransferase